MTEDAIRMIFDMSDERIRETETAFHRYLYSEIDWDARLIALDGPRGVGKTTMFLQHLKENPVEAESSLYVSIDNIWLNAQDPYAGQGNASRGVLQQPAFGHARPDISKQRRQPDRRRMAF